MLIYTKYLILDYFTQKSQVPFSCVFIAITIVFLYVLHMYI